MRNKIIEQTIDQVIDESKTPSDFKSVFKKCIKNKFDNNARSEDDLKEALAFIEEGDEQQ